MAMKVGSDSSAAAAASAASAASAAITTSTSTLDLLTDFVQQTQAELSVDPLTGQTPEQVDQQQEVQDQQRAEQQDRQDDAVRQLDAAIKDATVKHDEPLKNLLTKLKDAINAGPPKTPGEEKLLTELLNPGKLLQQSDGFGAQKASLPPAVQKAVEYIKFVLENPLPSAESDLATLENLAAGHTGEAGAATQPHEQAPVDSKEKQIKDFVAKYFSNGFEVAQKPTLDKPLPEKPQAPAQPQRTATNPGGLKAQDGAQPPRTQTNPGGLKAQTTTTDQAGKPTPATKNAELPKDVRPDTPAFAKLSPDEQKFVLTADSRQIGAYNQLPKEQKSVFRELQPHERATFLKLPDDQKKFVETLKPEERSHFLNLHPDGRIDLLKKTPEQRAVVFAEVKAQQAEAKKQPPEKLANTVGKELLSQLGIKPEKKPQLLEKARALAYNFLASSKGDLAQAQIGTMKELIKQPEVQKALEKEVNAAIKAAVSGVASQGASQTGETSESGESSEASSSSESGEAKPSESSSFGGASGSSRKGAISLNGGGSGGGGGSDEQKSEQKAEAKQEKVADQQAFKVQQGVNYAQHFQKIRHILMPEFAMKLVQPGVTRDQIVEGMKKAVMVSADYAESHPPRRASARYQQIRKGFAARQLFG